MAPQTKPIAVDNDMAGDARQWLANQAQTQDLCYLLVHADDGVIWGWYNDGDLKLSSEVFGDQIEPLDVELRAITLQQARLFGERGELLVWRSDGGFNAYLITDSAKPDSESVLEEQHLLWGDRIVKQAEGFTLLREGQQGLYHAPPIELSQGQRAALKVRHYIDYDGQGQAFISTSRLVGLAQANEEEENGA